MLLSKVNVFLKKEACWHKRSLAIIFGWIYCGEAAWSSLFKKNLPIYKILFVIVVNISYKSVLFNLFVIVEPLIYFRVCHGTPVNKTLKNTNYLQENQIFLC